MGNLKKSKVINFVTFLTSLFIALLFTIPIAIELDGTLSTLLLMVIICVAIVFLDEFFKRKIYEFIDSEVKRYKYKHVKEFFDYIEDDKEFLKNVLREIIPIYDDERKKIGEQTVYSALSSKKHIFINKD